MVEDDNVIFEKQCDELVVQLNLVTLGQNRLLGRNRDKKGIETLLVIHLPMFLCADDAYLCR